MELISASATRVAFSASPADANGERVPEASESTQAWDCRRYASVNRSPVLRIAAGTLVVLVHRGLLGPGELQAALFAQDFAADVVAIAGIDEHVHDGEHAVRGPQVEYLWILPAQVFARALGCMPANSQAVMSISWIPELVIVAAESPPG
jgi:hypothetical protein